MFAVCVPLAHGKDRSQVSRNNLFTMCPTDGVPIIQFVIRTASSQQAIGMIMYTEPERGGMAQRQSSSAPQPHTAVTRLIEDHWEELPLVLAAWNSLII